jgi:hypothetical protein
MGIDEKQSHFLGTHPWNGKFFVNLHEYDFHLKWTLVLLGLLDEEYWGFQYRVFYNTSITSIAG